jgi:hypothetical protein
MSLALRLGINCLRVGRRCLTIEIEDDRSLGMRQLHTLSVHEVSPEQ